MVQKVAEIIRIHPKQFLPAQLKKKTGQSGNTDPSRMCVETEIKTVQTSNKDQSLCAGGTCRSANYLFHLSIR